jgi:hypothetical protein
MSFFPIKVKSYEHILKMFDLGKEIVLVVKHPAGVVDMLVSKDKVLEYETGIRNSLLKYELVITGIKG